PEFLAQSCRWVLRVFSAGFGLFILGRTWWGDRMRSIRPAEGGRKTIGLPERDPLHALASHDCERKNAVRTHVFRGGRAILGHEPEGIGGVLSCRPVPLPICRCATSKP